MDTTLHLGQTVLSLLLVLGVLVVFLWGLRRLQNSSLFIHKGGKKYKGMFGSAPKRLRVLENLLLDAKHRVVLIQEDHLEYTVLLSPQKPVVLNTKTIPQTQDAKDN